MKIVMIGAGNVATNIAKTLANIGETPVQIWSRTLASAETLANAVGTCATSDWDSVVKDADVYIVAVKDDAMLNVIDLLCAHCKHGVFVHTAGTMSMSMFTGKAEHYGVLYPMQTFSKQKEVDFRTVPCFVEASDKHTLDIIMELARLLSDNVRELAESERKWLHIAAVFSCNFANVCNAMAAQILERHGLSFDVMLPLLDETVAKLHRLHPREAQTGPASRGDVGVVSKHLAMLKDNKELSEVYSVLSNYILKNRE